MLNVLFYSIYRYRDFILDSVRRNFQSRYQSSFLGAIWLILQPVAMISVYTLVFSSLMHARLPDITTPFAYSIYLCSGVLTWGLFTETLNGLINVFLDNANILKKLNFPRICLPIIVSISSLINFLIIFTLFVLFMIFSNTFPGWIFFAIIPVLLVQMIFTVGLGVILGVMNVFVRDVKQFIGILLHFWFWFTPIVYAVNMLPEWACVAMRFNPMAMLVESYQSVLLYHNMPNWIALIPVAAIALLLFAIGWRMFQRHLADILDEI